MQNIEEHLFDADIANTGAPVGFKTWWGHQYMHYRGFWDIWSGNCMGVKTSEMGCFTFQIIISNHKTSFKKFQKKSEILQKISPILLTESQFSWTFFALY